MIRDGEPAVVDDDLRWKSFVEEGWNVEDEGALFRKFRTRLAVNSRRKEGVNRKGQ